MSAKAWTDTAELPHGFRVTIERNHKGTRETHTFPSKTGRRNTAVQAASYKQGFLCLVACEPLTREEWARAFPKAAR